MNTSELITKMKSLLETIITNQASSKFKDHNEARKAASELKQLAGTFKKTSGLEDKAAKDAKK